jgi:ATP-dependent 26S proteasome regulatory subunit
MLERKLDTQDCQMKELKREFLGKQQKLRDEMNAQMKKMKTELQDEMNAKSSEMEENWKTFIEDQRRMASVTVPIYTMSDNMDKVGGGIVKIEMANDFKIRKSKKSPYIANF